MKDTRVATLLQSFENFCTEQQWRILRAGEHLSNSDSYDRDELVRQTRERRLGGSLKYQRLRHRVKETDSYRDDYAFREDVEVVSR
jgi:hypothetical protein